MECEFKALSALNEVAGVVRCIDFFKAWKHVFLVEEYVEGQSLANWIAINYPFSPTDDLQGYITNIKKIIKDLSTIILQMHSVGIAMGDLQKQNIMISTNFNVTLIDFELARATTDEGLFGMETKGFVHKLCKNAEERDWYAFSRILQYCVLPIGPVADLNNKVLE